MASSSTRVIPGSDVTGLSRDLVLLNHPQAYAAWPAFFYARCGQPVPTGDYRDWDDEVGFGVYDNYLLAFASDCVGDTDIYRWTDVGWELWAPSADVDESDDDNPESPQNQSYYRVPAQ